MQRFMKDGLHKVATFVFAQFY